MAEKKIHPNVLNVLAAVGFLAIILGIVWLATYSTRYVPTVVNRAGTAAVYLGSLFTPSGSQNTASTTISFGTTPATTTTQTYSTMTSNRSEATEYGMSRRTYERTPTAGRRTSTAVAFDGTTPPALHGLSDLVVEITAMGYLSAASTDSFVPSATVPAGNRPAIRFTIKNIGTNSTGSWRFSATIPTTSGFIYQSVPQQSLNPGDSIDYTLGFDQAIRGANQTISVTANFDHAVAESDTTNDTASTQLTILGS